MLSSSWFPSTRSREKEVSFFPNGISKMVIIHIFYSHDKFIEILCYKSNHSQAWYTFHIDWWDFLFQVLSTTFIILTDLIKVMCQNIHIVISYYR
jgi:hypothetical protein